MAIIPLFSRMAPAFCAGRAPRGTISPLAGVDARCPLCGGARPDQSASSVQAASRAKRQRMDSSKKTRCGLYMRKPPDDGYGDGDAAAEKKTNSSGSAQGIAAGHGTRCRSVKLQSEEMRTVRATAALAGDGGRTILHSTSKAVFLFLGAQLRKKSVMAGICGRIPPCAGAPRLVKAGCPCYNK